MRGRHPAHWASLVDRLAHGHLSKPFNSAEQGFGLAQRAGQRVDFVHGVVAGERGTTGRRHAESGRGAASCRCVSGPDGDAMPVDHRRHVMRMGVLEGEGRRRRALVARLADDADRIDLAELLVRVGDKLFLMRADRRLADAIDVVERSAKGRTPGRAAACRPRSGEGPRCRSPSPR